MPWKSVFENGKWKVKSIQDGSVKGSHPTKQRADAQVRALYAKAPDKGMRHGGAVRKNNLPATSPTRPSSLGQASSSSTVGMGHGGKVTAYKKGQPMAGGMGMRGGGSMKKMAGYKHGGETGMAYESQGPNHEGTLPQTTPPTTKLQANVIGKGGAVLPGKRYGGKVKKMDGYEHGGEVVPGQNKGKYIRENENGPGSGAKKSGYPFGGDSNYMMKNG